MVVVSKISTPTSIEVKGKLGRPNGLGYHTLGWTELGDDFEDAGYYQTRPTRKGRVGVRMRHYWPSNPQTTAQQAHRTIFADGVASWHALDASTKQQYSKAKYPKGLSGFNRYMREYLNENKA